MIDFPNLFPPPPHVHLLAHFSVSLPLSPTPALAHWGRGLSPTLEKRYGNVITSLMDGAMSRYMVQWAWFCMHGGVCFLSAYIHIHWLCLELVSCMQMRVDEIYIDIYICRIQ